MLTVKDLMRIYNITRQGVRRFVDKHIDEINSGGIEHAKPTADGWQFDAEAVRIIDDLRGFSQVAVLEQIESERISELQQENENLRQLLLIVQSKLIKTQEDLQNNQQKLLAAESHSKDSQAELTLEQALHKVTKQQLEDSKRIFNETKSQLDESNRQLEKIKNRGLFDRIFNNF